MGVSRMLSYHHSHLQMGAMLTVTSVLACKNDGSLDSKTL